MPDFNIDKCDGSGKCDYDGNGFVCDCCGKTKRFYMQIGSNPQKFCIQCGIGIGLAVKLKQEKIDHATNAEFKLIPRKD